jgi:hypothetical protein
MEGYVTGKMLRGAVGMVARSGLGFVLVPLDESGASVGACMARGRVGGGSRKSQARTPCTHTDKPVFLKT